MAMYTQSITRIRGSAKLLANYVNLTFRAITRTSLLRFALLGMLGAKALPVWADPIQDRLAITDVLAQYAYRWDGKDAAGFVEIFTADAVMERWRNGELIADSVLEGHPEILAYAEQSHRGRLADRQTRHNFSNLIFLELGESAALTENMALITHQTAGNPPVASSSGIYRISWLKTGEGWKIQRRILYSDSGPAR